MRKLFFRALLLVPCVCFFQAAFSQQMDSVMAVYEANFPKEKIHLHFDRVAYNKDETIFYKAYILSGTDLSTISQNVYVEWYDTTGQLIRQTVAPLFQSTARGSFEIPNGYRGNFIHVRAFTKWMLNDDSAFLFDKDILLNSPTVSAPKQPPVIRTRVDAFPEGGGLVQGLASRIAFKATNQFGTPVTIRGSVYNGKNKVDTLVVKHDGMGSFTLTPQPGETYQLNWTDENGKRGTTQLEAAKPQGAVIGIKQTNDKAQIQVQRTASVPDNFKKLSLWVHMNQSLFYKVSINMSEKTTIAAEIPIDEMPTGILQFTLFTSDMIPVSERIIFVNNRMHEFNAKVSFPMVNVGKRGRNIVDIAVSDTSFTNMSVSITDAAGDMPEKNSIYSDLLLSSEIKGKVYNPGYYLMSDADSITANLDLVMLTNGWRRFDWEKVKAGIFPEIKFPAEKSFMKITGKVFGAKSVSSATPMQLNFILQGKDSSKHFAFAPIDRNGDFEIPDQFFYDTLKAYYNFNGNAKIGDVTQVQLSNGLLRQTAKKIGLSSGSMFNPLSDSLARARMNFIFTEQEKLRKAMATATLQEVVVKAKTKTNLQILEEKYTSGLFSGGDGISFDLTEDNAAMGLPDILSYLQGKVAGLQITGSGRQATLSWRGATPDLYMNESITQLDMVQTLAVSDVAYIKVFRPPFFGTMSGGSGGAIAIYTKKGADGRKAPANARGMEYAIIGGYSRFKEFFNPNYEKPDNNTEADLRNTLYWNPYVLTNKKSPKTRITFYNNDISKQFLFVLEGVNGAGKMVRVVRMVDPSVQD